MANAFDALRADSPEHHLPVETLTRLGRVAAATDDPAELMDQVVRGVTDVLGANYCEVLELLPDGNSFRVIAGAGCEAESVGRIAPDSMVWQALTTDTPLVLQDLRTETRFTPHPVLNGLGVVCGMLAAIPGRDRALGVLGAYSRNQRGYAARDGLFLQGVANVLAIFLQRHRSDEARRRSEAERRRVFDSPLIGIAFWASDGAIIEANDEFLRMIGYTRDDLNAGRVRWVDLTPPEHLHLDYGGLAEIKQTGRSTPYEKEYICKDGTRVPILIGGSGFSREGDRGVCFALNMTRTKRAERELIRLAERDQLLLANSWDVISVIAPDGTSIYTSPSVKRVVGYDAGKLLGRKVFANIHPDDVALAAAEIERVASAPGTQPPFVVRFRHKNGEWRRCECTGTNLLDHPAVNGLLFNSRDITDRERTEDDLRRSERRYRTLVTATSMMIWTATSDGEIVPNEDVNAFSGLPREASAGWGWLDAIHPDDRSMAEREWRSSLISGRPVAREVRIRRADGAWRWVAVRIVPVRDAGGTIEEWVGVGDDVTDLRQAAEELRRSERRYRSLVSALYQIVFVTDARGEITESAGYRTILGPDAPLTTAGWIAGIHPNDRHRTVDVWTGALASGRAVEVEYRVRRYDGEWRQVVGRAVPVLDDDGRAEEWVGVIEDLTDRRRAEEELRRSERRYRTLVTATPQIIWTMASGGEPDVVLGAGSYFGSDAQPGGGGVVRAHPPG